MTLAATTFITRVELHGVSHDSELYEGLHKAMEVERFFRIILDEAYRAYDLPHATYSRISGVEGLADAHAVNELAYATASAVHKDVGCVTASPPTEFRGLKPVF